MSWTDYFKKPKEKEPIRNVFGLSETLEESFTHTATNKEYKGVWTNYFKGRLKEKEPVRTVQEIEEMLEVSYTHTASSKDYKGVWTDYFKKLKEKDAQLPDEFLEVPYITITGTVYDGAGGKSDVIVTAKAVA